MSRARISRTRLVVLVAAGVAATTALTTASSASAGMTYRSGCAIVTDTTGDTAADVGAGAPATVPQSDQGLDITSVDVAANAHWVGTRVHVQHLDGMAPDTGGELFSVTMSIPGGSLVFGVGRYGNVGGVTGSEPYGWAGVQQGTLAPHDISAHDVQVKLDTFASTVTVVANRQALEKYGANLSGYALNVMADSGRQYANEFTVNYDNASGSKPYKLGARSCLGLPA